jgi:hypothetical protein
MAAWTWGLVKVLVGLRLSVRLVPLLTAGHGVTVPAGWKRPE